jgi:hypothetical protein
MTEISLKKVLFVPASELKKKIDSEKRNRKAKRASDRAVDA